MSLSESQQTSMISALLSRVAELESQTQYLNTATTAIFKQMNSIQDSLIPIDKNITDLQAANKSNVSHILSLESSVKSLGNTVNSLTGTSGDLNYAEVKAAFDKAYNADVFILNQLLDVERFVNAPKTTQDFLMKGIDETLAGTGITDTTLQEYLKTPNTMNAPYSVPQDQFWAGLSSAFGNFFGGAAAGFAGISIPLLLGGGVLLLLLTRGGSR